MFGFTSDRITWVKLRLNAIGKQLLICLPMDRCISYGKMHESKPGSVTLKHNVAKLSYSCLMAGPEPPFLAHDVGFLTLGPKLEPFLGPPVCFACRPRSKMDPPFFAKILDPPMVPYNIRSRFQVGLGLQLARVNLGLLLLAGSLDLLL